MTIPLSTKSYDHYAGNNSLKVYPVTFPTYENSTLTAYVTNIPDWSHIAGDILTGLKVFDLVLDTDYTTQNIARPNTSITLLDASDVPDGWSGPIPERQEWLSEDGFLNTGYYLYVEFLSNPMRPSVLTNGNQLVPALSKDLDRLAMHIKALDHKVNEGFNDLIHLQTGSGASGLIPTGTTPGEYLEFDGFDPIWQSGEYKGYSGRYGANLDLKSNREALLWLFDFMYVPPGISLSCSPATTIREKGTVVASVTMTATTTKLLNNITSVTHYRNGVLVDTEGAPIPGGGVETYTNNTAFSDNMSFYSIVGDGTGTTQSNTVTYPFVYPYYSGTGAPGANEAAIEAMTKLVIANTNSLNRSFTIGTAGHVYYIAYPKSYGNLTSIKDVNNFESLSSWARSDLTVTGLDGVPVTYNKYEFNIPQAVNTTSFTFIK